jgi:predicted butyrate kinase (DUF1464 family)
MPRVAGTDPGTSSLDVLVLEDATVADQCRFAPHELKTDPALPVRWLDERGPFDLIAGPSGYGLPLVRARDATPEDVALMSLTRTDDQGRGGQGVLGFRALLRGLCASPLPVVFLPGVIHLPTVPVHRKLNRIDLGTADKLCVAALALAQRCRQLGIAPHEYRGCVVELGSAFSACLVIDGGCVVDGLGGTSGPVGWGSGGAWDGEVAYLLSPLGKRDLFGGGASSVADRAAGKALFRESLLKAVAALRAVTPFDEVVLSGRLPEIEPQLAEDAAADLARFGAVERLASLSGAWVKHAAQGAALLADGLAGGQFAPLVEHLRLPEAGGTVLDFLQHPRAAQVKALLA